MTAAVHAAAQRIERAHGVSISLQQTAHFPPCAFDAAMRQSIEASATAFNYSQMHLASGAGHDAVYVARRCPTAMIFVPCERGISHNDIENADPAHLHAGANVLLHAMLARAQRP